MNRQFKGFFVSTLGVSVVAVLAILFFYTLDHFFAPTVIVATLDIQPRRMFNGIAEYVVTGYAVGIFIWQCRDI